MSDSSRSDAGVLIEEVGESTVFEIWEIIERRVFMGCENNCINQHRIDALEKDLESFREKSSRDHKEFYERIEKNEKNMIESQGDRKHIRDQLDEINGNVKSLMQKPEKRYETIVTGILTGIIGAIIGFVMSGILPM